VPGRKAEATITSQESHVFRFMGYLAETSIAAMPHAYTAVIADSRTASPCPAKEANEPGWPPSWSWSPTTRQGIASRRSKAPSPRTSRGQACPGSILRPRPAPHKGLPEGTAAPGHLRQLPG
jgi:hypothetical protein